MKINAIKFLTLSILTATTFVSCNNDEPEPTPPFVPVTINPTLISKRNVGVSSSVGISEQKTIYNESTNWNLLLNQIDSYYLPFGINYTDIFTGAKIWKLGLKNIDFRFHDLQKMIQTIFNF